METIEHKTKNKNGFGLVEMVIVCGIIVMTFVVFMSAEVGALRLFRAGQANLESSLLAGEALEAVRALGAAGKTLLFVGTKASAKETVKEAAMALHMPYVTERWLGGTLTNFKVITDRVQYWQNLKRQKEAGEFQKYTKHEQTKLSQHITKLDYMFRGLEELKRIPHALVVVDLKEESLAVREARHRSVPVIALSNTDTDPLLAEYLIPGNDNAKASITYTLQKIGEAYNQGAAQKAVLPEAAEPALEKKDETGENKYYG